MNEKYKVVLSKQVSKFLNAHHELKFRFAEKVVNISKSPFDNNLDIKKLQGEGNHYRLRIGKYRFLYKINNNKILIYFYDVNSRGNIY